MRHSMTPNTSLISLKPTCQQSLSIKNVNTVFVPRIGDNDTVRDVLGPLGYFRDTARKVTIQEPGEFDGIDVCPSNMQVEFGGIDVCPSNMQVSDSQVRSQTAILPVTHTTTTMLIITALIAWSAASAASVMPVHAIRSAHKSTTWNVTNTPFSGSSVSMDSNYYSSEERVAPIETILENFHAPTQTSVTIEAMREELTRLTQNNKNFLNDWKKSLMSQKPKPPIEDVREVMFSTLAGRYQGDGLRCFLIAGTKIDTTRDIALELLDLQVQKWVHDGRDEEEVYKFLELDQPESNPFESPLFSKWSKFEHKKYKTTKHRMYNVLAKKFKGDDLAKILVEGAEKGHNDSKGSARKLLDYQVDKWQKAKRNEEDVFKLLKLDETDENPLESPVFPKWANFVWGRYPDDNPNEMILNKLSLFYKSKNALVGGLDALDWATPNSQNTAARKILEYQFKQWKNKGAKEVFDILDLHQTDSNLFSRPAFAAWVDFVSSKFSNKMEAFETTFSVIGLDYKDNLETILPILKRVYKNDLDKLLSEGTQIERVKPVAEKLQKAVVQRQQDGKLLLARKKIKNYDWEELPPAKRQNSNRPPAIGQNSKSPPGPATTSKLAPASTSKQASDLVLAQVLAPVPDPVPDLDPALDPVSASGPARASASDPSLDADSAPAAERPIIDLNKPPDERH